MADSDNKPLSVEEQVARIKAAKEAAKREAAEKAAAATAAMPSAHMPSGGVPSQAVQAAGQAVQAAGQAVQAAGQAAQVAGQAGQAAVTVPLPGSVEEKVAQIKAAKAAAAEKMKADAAAKTAAGGTIVDQFLTPGSAVPAPGSVEEKVAQIKAAKAAAALKTAADAEVKNPTDPRGGSTIAVDTPTGPVAVPPGTPEAIARAAAAHEKAKGATGIDAHGTPANKPAVQLLAAAAANKKGVAAASPAKKKDPEVPLPPPSQLYPRREILGFFSLGTAMWVFFWGWMAAVGALFTRFMFPNVLYESDPKFNAGRKNDFPESPKVYEKYKQDQAVWIVRLTEEGQDRLVALSTVCTHLGCTPNWLEVEQKYKCPCHGSGYYIDGVNFEGPTPRPLERFRIFVDATGNIIVDKAKKYRQDLQQWNENQSYLTMS